MKAIISSIRAEPLETKIWIYSFLAPNMAIIFIGALCFLFGSFRVGYAWSDGVNQTFLYVTPPLIVLLTLPFYILGGAAKVKKNLDSFKNVMKGFAWILIFGTGMSLGTSYVFLVRFTFPYLSLAMSNDYEETSAFVILDNEPFGRGDFTRELELREISSGAIWHAILRSAPSQGQVCLTYTKSPIGRHFSVVDNQRCHK